MKSEQQQYGAIFDMDGTLADNIPVHMRVFQGIFKEHGVDVSLDVMLKECNGLRNPEILEKFLPHTTDAEREVITHEKEVIYRSYYREHAKEIAGLTNFLKDLKANGVKLALGTSAPIENLEFFMEVLGVGEYFDEKIYDKSVVNGKPHPEVFLTAAERLGVDADHCIVFEDAVMGVKAAHNAKMRVACVTTSHTSEELFGMGAIHTMDDYTGMNYEKYMELFKIAPTYPKFIQS